MTYGQHIAYIILQCCITHLDATILFVVLFFITIKPPCIDCMSFYLLNNVFRNLFNTFFFNFIVDLNHNIKYSLIKVKDYIK